MTQSVAEVPAEHERSAVIAWMREQAVLCGRAANAAIEPRVKMAEVEKARWYVLTAACIERGAHLRTASNIARSQGDE